MSLNIIGISALYHDSACCVLKNGQLVAAAQEERFSRMKNDPSLPQKAFMYCLKEAGLALTDLDYLAYYELPEKKLARQLWSGIHKTNEKQLHTLDPGQVEREIRDQLGYEGPVMFMEHHMAHAASSFFFSGFDEAAILTVDGVGEWATTTYGVGQGTRINLLEEVHFPDSIGLLYSTITSYLGFKVNNGEYKVMGLAPYGRNLYAGQFRKLIQLGAKGQYHLDMDYFDFVEGRRMYSDRLPALFGQPPRPPETEMLQFHKDVAKSLQVALEEILLEKAAYLHRHTGQKNLCMAGGVALNCVANGRILREGPFTNLFVQPASNDSGGALGAAAYAHTALTNQKLNGKMEHVYLGPGYRGDDVRRLLDATSLQYRDYRDNPGELVRETARLLADEKVIGWFHGRMEFGPRSLGARSILADPRHPEMRDRINAMVKKREAFRPFAPAVLIEKMHEHFDLDHASPFMLETCQVKSPLDLPAITHVDGSARVQTVHPETNPRFTDLLREFDKLTGCPILLNTSFNVRGEPIVCTPEDALTCFIKTDIDCLILGDFIIEKEGNSLALLQMIQQSVRGSKDVEISANVYTFI